MWKTEYVSVVVAVLIKSFLFWEEAQALKCYVCRYTDIDKIMNTCKLQTCPTPKGSSVLGPACKAWLHPASGYTKLSCWKRLARQNSTMSRCLEKAPNGFVCTCATDGCNDVRKNPCACMRKLNKENAAVRTVWRAKFPDNFQKLKMSMTEPPRFPEYYTDSVTGPPISDYTDPGTDIPPFTDTVPPPGHTPPPGYFTEPPPPNYFSEPPPPDQFTKPPPPDHFTKPPPPDYFTIPPPPNYFTEPPPPYYFTEPPPGNYLTEPPPSVSTPGPNDFRRHKRSGL